MGTYRAKGTVTCIARITFMGTLNCMVRTTVNIVVRQLKV